MVELYAGHFVPAGQAFQIVMKRTALATLAAVLLVCAESEALSHLVQWLS
jgi:hypothetical protein